MPLINTSVPNLIQGVSQQPDASRFAGQCEEQENALSSVVEGLKKRPNTRHVARLLGQAISSDSFVHFINRSESEKYVLIHNGTDLRAWNIITGASAMINGASSYTPPSGSYFDISAAKKSLKALTIADSTFLLNTKIGVGLKQDGGGAVAFTPDLDKKALIFIKQGDYKKEYSVKITGGIRGGSGAAITLGLTRYTYFTNGYHPAHGGSTIYRWRVSSISVQNGGSNYSNSLTLNVTSNLAIYTQPSIQFNVVGGVIQSSGHSITNSGDFEGSGTGLGESGINPPTVSTTITDAIPSTVTSPVTASITSEDSTDANHASTEQILNRLVSTSAHSTDLTDLFSSAFYIKKNSNTNLVELLKIDQTEDFTISASDGLAGNGIGVVYKEVSSISDLPLVAPDGFVVKVKGDTELNEDDYYVRFETNNGQPTTSPFSSTVGEGSWVETVAPNIVKGINNSTMPHVLVNDAVDSFLIQEATYTERVAGDDLSNPLPSLEGQTISNLFFFKNRIGFLSNDNIVLTESGLGNSTESGEMSYNLMRTTVTTLLDSDPIDVSVSSSRVTQLLAAKGYQENLVLFSEKGQLVLKGGDVLTPKTVSITPVTNFNVESTVDPLPLGSYLYFPFNRGNFSGLREFSVNATTDNYDSIDITEQAPSYVTNEVIDIAGTTTEDMLVVLSANETKSLFLYKYFWNNNNKILSSWSKFTFNDDIRGVEFIDSTLYLVTVDDEDNTHLLSLPLESGLTDIDHLGNTADFLTLLDKRVRAKITSGSSVVEFEQSDGSYSGANADHPYTFFNGSIPSGGQALSEVFVDSNGVTHSLKYQNVGSGGQVLLTDGNASATLYGYVGVPYTMKYKFSTQVFKAQTQKGASPTASSSMQVRNGSLFFDDTHTFDIKVTPENRPTTTTTFSADDVPEAEQLGAIKFAEGNFRFPVYSKAKHADIVIENDSPFDSKFSSAEFESFVHPRSSRYG